MRKKVGFFPSEWGVLGKKKRGDFSLPPSVHLSISRKQTPQSSPLAIEKKIESLVDDFLACDRDLFLFVHNKYVS